MDVTQSDRAELNNQLKAVRTRLGLSQQELARAAGIARQTIGGVEAGIYALSLSVALRISKALGCPIDELFWLNEEAPTVTAVAAKGADWQCDGTRVSLTRIADSWIAHPLSGEAAFRTEMTPADGIAMNSPNGANVHVSLADDADRLGRSVAVAGCTPALSLWARSAERWHPGLRVNWFHANSSSAIECLKRGEVHAAGMHYSDSHATNRNLQAVRQAFPGEKVVLVNLGIWEEGLVVASGNPKSIKSVADLGSTDITISNREKGSGCRRLLDEIMVEAGMKPGDIAGYDHEDRSHYDVARTVQSGKADAAVSVAAVANAFGLEFLPIREVSYDLAVPKRYLDHEPVKQLLSTLDHRWVRTQLAALGGYDTSRMGEVTGETV
ncbi:MAG TPA: substrate-binding domain-containing protein [Capsulimonadaceae bacterium]|jgi:molybdate-binding protein/DNA-binding XRE family transcriptional regulator